jgi:hypothetical protein
VGTSLFLLLALSGTAAAQQVRVTGTVTAPGGQPLSGALVRVPETDSSTITNQAGKYTILAPSR